MSIHQLIFRNIKRNLRYYHLYFFAIVCSVAIYFAFVTLQYEAAVGELGESFRVQAGIEVASYLLVFIVTVFLLYANGLFMKRRTKEIGLYQLAGMTKRQVSFLFMAENAVLYAGSLIAGIISGFIGSKLLMMILYKLLGIDRVAVLNFSWQAVGQTVIVIVLLYVLLMLMTSLRIKRQTLLALFQQQNKTESTGRRVRWYQVVIGIAGILLIASGYYTSSILFDRGSEEFAVLTKRMGYTLASTIVGTYFFYKGSVTLLLLCIRKSKSGYLNIKQVLSIGSIMFRMRTNAFLLTVISTVTALAIGFLSLGYISYYSLGKDADAATGGADFFFVSEDDQQQFQQELNQAQIRFEKEEKEIVQLNTDLSKILKEDSSMSAEQNMTFISSAQAGLEVETGHVILAGDDDRSNATAAFKAGEAVVHTGEDEVYLQLVDIVPHSPLPSIITYGGPAAVLAPADYRRLQSAEAEPQKLYFISLQNRNDEEKAVKLFSQLNTGDIAISKQLASDSSKMSMGLYMFIVGFLGLAFLLTSGCILYIKQMDEGDSEQPTYTILRKIGFTKTDLRKGIVRKQLFHFGIPLLIGLSHGYFAVKSGWFWFGNSLWVPMTAVMVIFTLLYSTFGVLSIFYYKHVITRSL
ncbi:FtsX-like permease family protein [Terribacillus saccharophilus]|uniref:ABC transporter permease n=1 Tax=Terribacillus saccharophilus TaxID=361277 RepID=UPI003982A6A6